MNIYMKFIAIVNDLVLKEILALLHLEVNFKEPLILVG